LTAVTLGAIALLSLFGAFMYVAQIHWVLAAYMLWLASLGALGSIAFIGMNALAVQDDATFDLTNTKLILLRIALGALFGVVLSLPFGFRGFTEFVGGLTAGGVEPESGFALQSLLLLLPFVLGFSTPLVIMILNQFVEGVGSFFGKKGAAPASTPVVGPSDAARPQEPHVSSTAVAPAPRRRRVG
jgi:hypothetical protein